MKNFPKTLNETSDRNFIFLNVIFFFLSEIIQVLFLLERSMEDM